MHTEIYLVHSIQANETSNDTVHTFVSAVQKAYYPCRLTKPGTETIFSFFLSFSLSPRFCPLPYPPPSAAVFQPDLGSKMEVSFPFVHSVPFQFTADINLYFYFRRDECRKGTNGSVFLPKAIQSRL